MEKMFPMGGKCGKIFSNRWKTGEKSFQSLENGLDVRLDGFAENFGCLGTAIPRKGFLYQLK
mgnify:CR=1 FL=1